MEESITVAYDQEGSAIQGNLIDVKILHNHPAPGHTGIDDIAKLTACLGLFKSHKYNSYDRDFKHRATQIDSAIKEDSIHLDTLEKIKEREDKETAIALEKQQLELASERLKLKKEELELEKAERKMHKSCRIL